MGMCGEIKAKRKRTLSTNYSSVSTRASSQLILQQKPKIQSKISDSEMKLCLDTDLMVTEQKDFPAKKYIQRECIGHGSFGKVHLSENKYNHNFVAIKKIEKLSINKIDGLDLSNEIEIQKKTCHPNILKIYEFYNTEEAYYIVDEYCQYGDLFRVIRNNFSENEIAFIFYQLLSALCYLHQNGITHRDIKLENILIKDIDIDPKKGEKYYWIKLIDFGAAKYISKKKEKAIVGTSYYMAPEVLNGKYNYKCDLWSAGVILYQLTTNKSPFGGTCSSEIEESIKEGVYYTEYEKFIKRSPELKDLISRLLEKNVNKRITALEALNHPFFEKFNPKKIFEVYDKPVAEYLIENLRNYQIHSKFQQAVLVYLCHNMKYNNKVKNGIKLFNLFNKSGTGKLLKSELLKGLSKFIGDEEAKDIIDELFLSLDSDNTDYIEYEGFLAGCLWKDIFKKEENLQQAFNFFTNSSEDKVVILQKLKCMFKNGKKKINIEKICKEIIESIDVNKDGKIGFFEFKNFVSLGFCY